MNRVLTYLLGPELYWILTCVVVWLITRRNMAPDPAITDWLDRYWAMLPFLIVPLTFAFFFLPGGSRWWLLLRVDIAILIGLSLASTLYCNGMTYHKPSAGPGVGMGWMAMHMFGYLLMVVGTAATAVVIWWRGRGAS